MTLDDNPYYKRTLEGIGMGRSCVAFLLLSLVCMLEIITPETQWAICLAATMASAGWNFWVASKMTKWDTDYCNNRSTR